MSIHASKGLQFPVCILADTAAAFNDADARSKTVYSAALGVGFSYFDENEKQKRTTVSREIILDDIRRRSAEEELAAFIRCNDTNAGQAFIYRRV